MARSRFDRSTPATGPKARARHSSRSRERTAAVSGIPEIDALLAYLRDAHPEWSVSVDEPASPRGHWFVDLSHPSGRRAVVEGRPGTGYGLSAWSAGSEPLYGEGHDEAHAT